MTLLPIIAIIFVILSSLFSSGVCRALVEQHATTIIKTKNESLSYGIDVIHDPGPTDPPQPKPKEHCRAVVRTRYAKTFMGTRACISLYKPTVQANQWSSGRMKLSDGGESIEAGWMVNSEVFKDNEAHLYAKFSAGGKECINTQCEGFVQVDTKVPLGFIPKTYSQVNGDHYTWNLTIDKSQSDGNWWLSVIAAGNKIPIGHWPKTLFSTLADSASQVEWGGEINNRGSTSPEPDMGSGITADYNTKKCAYFQQVTVVNEGFQNVEPVDTVKDFDCAFYTVKDDGYIILIGVVSCTLEVHINECKVAW